MTVLMGLDQRLKMARLYLCTDLRGSLDAFAEFVEAAFSGGVDMLEVRQPGLEVDEEVEALELARTISYAHQGIVVVSDRPEVAKQFNADAIQLGQDDAEPRVARTFLHQWGLIGRVTSSEEQARAAFADPEVNFASVGPSSALDLVALAAALQPPGEPASKPWFSAGGVTDETIGDVLAAGARRVLVTRAITRAQDPEAAARRHADRVRQAWADDPAMAGFLRRTMGAGGGATFRTNADGSIVMDDDTDAPPAMPTGEPGAR